jgi:hypothetical protein
MLSPETRQLLEHLREHLRVEVSTKKTGGGAYYNGSPAIEVTVRLCLEDEVLSESTSTTTLD